MIYVVALNMQRFTHLCRAMNLRGDGRHPVTGEQGMQYLHRAETLMGMDIHKHKVYLSEGWTNRADYANFIVCLKAFHILGGKVEGAEIGLVVPYKRFNRHLGTRPGGNNGLRVISGGNYPQP